jgi:hypothetical protein
MASADGVLAPVDDRWIGGMQRFRRKLSGDLK